MRKFRHWSAPDSGRVLLPIAIADLSIRYSDVLARFFPFRYLGGYGDELFFSVASLGIGFGILDVTQWLLFVVAIGIVVPFLYPEPLREVTKTVRARSIISLTGVGFAIVVSDIGGTGDAGLVLVIAVGFFVAIGVLLRIEGISPYDETGQLVSGLNRFTRRDGIARDELDRAKAYDGWRRSFALGTFAVAAYVVLFAPTLVIAVVVMMLAKTFPIPDFLVLAYALLGITAERTERLSQPPESLNVESYLLQSARHATNGIHSMFVVMLFGIGVLATVITPVLIFRPTSGLLLLTIRPPILPLLLWNVIGLYVLSLGGALYGLWFWIRMLPRVTAFLERWNDEPQKTRLVSRPKLLLVPSFVATSVATAGLSNSFLGENRFLFAVVWPPVAIGIAWVVRRTRRRHPTATRREDFTIAAAVLIAYLTLMDVLAIGSGNLAVLLSPQIGLFCGMILYVVGIGRVNRYGNRYDYRYGDDTDDERRYAFPLYLGIGGMFALLTTGYLTGTLQILILVSAILLLGFAAVMAVTKYYRL